MDTFDRMNSAIDYIESNIDTKNNYSRITALACCLKSQFQRLFAYLAEIPFSEYARLEQHFFGG